MAQRSVKREVDLLAAGVDRSLGRQGVSNLPIESWFGGAPAEEVLQLVYRPLDDLALARRPPATGLRPCPAVSSLFRVAVSSAPYSSIQRRQSHPTPVRTPCRQVVGVVAVCRYEGFSYRPLIWGGGVGLRRSGGKPPVVCEHVQ